MNVGNLVRIFSRIITTIALAVILVSFVAEKVADHVYACPAKGQAIHLTTCVITVPSGHLLVIDGNHTIGNVIQFWWNHQFVNQEPGMDSIYYIPGTYIFSLEEGSWRLESFDNYDIIRNDQDAP